MRRQRPRWLWRRCWGMRRKEGLILVVPLGTAVHVTVPSAAALAAGFSLGPFRVAALDKSVPSLLCSRSISGVTNEDAPNGEILSNSMVRFSARIRGQSVELTNLKSLLRFTVSMTEQLLTHTDAGLVSERACVYWNTTAAAWRKDGMWSLASQILALFGVVSRPHVGRPQHVLRSVASALTVHVHVHVHVLFFTLFVDLYLCWCTRAWTGSCSGSGSSGDWLCSRKQWACPWHWQAPRRCVRLCVCVCARQPCVRLQTRTGLWTLVTLQCRPRDVRMLTRGDRRGCIHLRDGLQEFHAWRENVWQSQRQGGYMSTCGAHSWVATGTASWVASPALTSRYGTGYPWVRWSKLLVPLASAAHSFWFSLLGGPGRFRGVVVLSVSRWLNWAPVHMTPTLEKASATRSVSYPSMSETSWHVHFEQ